MSIAPETIEQMILGALRAAEPDRPPPVRRIAAAVTPDVVAQVEAILDAGGEPKLLLDIEDGAPVIRVSRA